MKFDAPTDSAYREAVMKHSPGLRASRLPWDPSQEMTVNPKRSCDSALNGVALDSNNGCETRLFSEATGTNPLGLLVHRAFIFAK